MGRFLFLTASMMIPWSLSAATYKLTDTDCKMLGNDEQKITANDAVKTQGRCVSKNGTLKCSYKEQSGKPMGQQDYQIIVEEDDFLMFQSQSGNIRVAADVTGGTYLYGMVYFAPEKGLMITKECAGTIQKF
jgi:hypothetical protein